MGDLSALRREVRARRRAIVGDERVQKSAAAAANLVAHLPATAGKIGVFLSLAEEIDTRPLLPALWQGGWQVYLPFTPGKGQALYFLPYQEDEALAPDALGILAPEDRAEARLPGHALDLVIVPLVAWDDAGHRLGMGGGFYDRTFAQSPRPPLWGFAYDCQQVAALPRAPWDVGLEAIATERGFVAFVNKRN
ncbi:MAG: 5-formyltetrahydrofolate cyclo-ligase [Cardiobacteriaceae bacterium]|nr:5-formyltetrahydrofolate cyclo-ligase [Cardiobacteriaceae bacterium]